MPWLNRRGPCRNRRTALYDTKADAEAAAKKHFNCTGAHQMGKQWMPCSTHGDANSHTQQKH